MMKPEMKKELYQQVTAGLIEQMENGVAIWQQPWVVSKAYQPQNGVSERLYTGFNRIYLGYVQANLGTQDPRWYTMNNVKSIGAKVKKGSKSFIVVYNAPKVDDRDPDNVKTYWLTKYYRIFNASQIDGLPEYDVTDNTPEQPDNSEDYPGIERLIEWCHDNLNDIQHGSDKAYYTPMLDTITMPHEDMFKRLSWYAQTLSHEIIHATGHESRLNRLEKGGFGTDTYAKEELVAEFGAAMLCGALDIPADMEQSAAYLKSWAKKCKDDPGMLISAANAAEKAADLVMEDAYATV